ncbi:hypothetical protein H257_12301 [Aphanomyces astaci]|uniref:Uncharacterized protein n=1 Tax=Aphanomyces astaci TaxID=112090 RepID=W4FZS5_APHAT|nr:hypothetical protein H257_12301 [Aphanomyces astaci]ETV72977.1 hypothetical protein H257_12301 [Aphanomyces astaci]|eukprot:XP_009837763.1 hypothetical protein H257_12301 [Aphanomyces astaci]
MLRRNNACLNLAALDTSYNAATSTLHATMLPARKRLSDSDATTTTGKGWPSTNAKRSTPVPIPEPKNRPFYCVNQDAHSRPGRLVM